MKSLAILLTLTLAFGALLVPAEDASAVATCVYGDIHNSTNDPCDGIVCIGHTQGRWVDCYPDLRGCPWQTHRCPDPRWP